MSLHFTINTPEISHLKLLWISGDPHRNCLCGILMGPVADANEVECFFDELWSSSTAWIYLSDPQVLSRPLAVSSPGRWTIMMCAYTAGLPCDWPVTSRIRGRLLRFNQPFLTSSGHQIGKLQIRIGPK